MNTVTIVIPTRDRWDRLVRAIESCQGYPVIVVADGDELTFARLRSVDYPNVTPILAPVHSGAVACRNFAIPAITTDGIIWATDDIEFLPGSIASAIRQYDAYFPDGDAVLGFVQDLDHHPSGMGLMDQKFLNRYPKRQPFNPAYWHFACQEIAWLAESLDRFQISDGVLVKHYHPCKYKELADDTHHDARRCRHADMQLMKERFAAGQMWGGNQ